MKKSNKFVIIRSAQAGVFFGKLKSFDAKTGVVVLNDARRLWYWSGAASLSQLAMEGVKNPDQCKFPCATGEHTILGVCEVIETTPAAKESIDGVPVWAA